MKTRQEVLEILKTTNQTLLKKERELKIIPQLSEQTNRNGHRKIMYTDKQIEQIKKSFLQRAGRKRITVKYWEDWGITRQSFYYYKSKLGIKRKNGEYSIEDIERLKKEVERSKRAKNPTS